MVRCTFSSSRRTTAHRRRPHRDSAEQVPPAFDLRSSFVEPQCVDGIVSQIDLMPTPSCCSLAELHRLRLLRPQHIRRTVRQPHSYRHLSGSSCRRRRVHPLAFVRRFEHASFRRRGPQPRTDGRRTGSWQPRRHITRLRANGTNAENGQKRPSLQIANDGLSFTVGSATSRRR